MADLASLVIGLRADVATLQSDLGKAVALNKGYADQAAQHWNRAGAAVNDALKDIAGKVVAAFAVDRLVEFGRQAIDTADQLNKMSQKVGVSVESLSALNVQARLSDVGIDGLQGGLAKLARNAADAASGSKQQAAAFQAMGVSLKDANGNLKSTEDILGAVAGKFAQYQDSATKTALAQQLFGKSGADLIPLLNQIGTEGFAKVREEAEKYGQVISVDTARASEAFNDNLTKLKLETEGFANSVVSQLLPGMVKLSGEFVEAGETTDKYAESAAAVASVVKGAALAFIALGEGVKAATNLVAASGDTIATILALPVKAGEALANGGIDAAKKQFADALTGIKSSWASAGEGVQQAVAGTKKAFDDLFGAFSNVKSGSETTVGALHKINAPLIENADASDKAAKAMQALGDAQAKAAGFLAQLAGGLSPADKAIQDYVKTIIQAQQIGDALERAYKDTGQAAQGMAAKQQFLAQSSKAANAVLDETNAKLALQGDVLGHLQQDYANQSALVGLTDRERAITEAVQKATDEWNKNTEAQITNKQSLDQVQTGAANAAGSLYDLTQKAKENEDAARELADIWKNAGGSISDAFSKWVVEGGSLMKSLTDIAKQVVEQIISYFVKLSVINPILNSIFGGTFGGGAGGGLLPTLSGAGGLIGSLGGGGSDAGTATASGNSSLFGTAQSGYSLFEGGKNLWQGFQSGYQSFFSGSDAFTMGPPTEAGSTSSYYGGGYTSGLGQAIGVAGSLYAGYNRYQQGGALGGVAGGAAYAYGTYALGAGVSTAVATGSLAAGFSAIPVVGWIAIAAMLIDKFSGGKLFGTDANKFKFGQQTLDIAAGGATLSAGADYVGQKALFGGSYHEWKSLDVPQEAIDAANAFFDALKKGTDNFAQQFGVKMGDVVGGAFTTTFDKHGNVTATSSVVNGVTYKDTADQFQERLVAENELAVLGQFDSKLSAAIDKYRENADELAGVVNSLAAAQLGFNEGLKLLALGSDQSTSGLLQLAEASGKFGESITDTISRILQSQAQYDQFVAQFKPATNYVDDYEASLSQINQAMLANIKQANDLAKAAGAQGASEQDLANIHKYAAQQAAQALAALESSAQSLAFGLGLTTQGSLDQVNQEVAALQSRAGNATQPIQNFGQAMSDAADRAKHAQDLLLGDLSPLNDQQKLQTALSGLRSGTVTQDQVLDIGRRLYASTAQYTALFNMVQAIGQHTGTTGFSGAATTGTHTGLSTEESKRLADLLKEQQSLQAAAQLQQYQTLAQQVAEIASSKGEDWQQVLKEMGVNIDDFEKGLNLTDQQTQDYITAIQNQTDSAGDNTKSIVDVLNQILVALGGTPTNSGGTPFGGDQPVGQFGGNGGTTANTPFGTGPVGSFGGGRSLSDGDANAVGAAVARHNPGLGHSQRGTRPVRAGATTRI